MQSEALSLEEQLKACVHCGMCLPACPTYQVTGNEGNSPRGRLYMINDFVKDQKDEPSIDDKTLEYLDNCLTCFACETVCPSGVDYAGILEQARSDHKATKLNNGFWGWLRFMAFKFLLPNRSFLNSARIMQRYFGFLVPMRIKPNLDFEYQKIQTNQLYLSEIDISDTPYDKRIVAMPLGCVMDTIYNKIHLDTIYVLNQFGYHVFVPDTGCCGALAAHSGEHELGMGQVKENLEEFNRLEFPVVMNSAGCGAFVKEHKDDLKKPINQGDNLMEYLENQPSELQVMDLIEALEKAPHDPFSQSFTSSKPVISSESEESQNGFQENKGRRISITYHPACHLNHRQGIAYNYLDLLKKIPNLDIKELHDADICCGSAGFYNLINPEMASEIGNLKATHVENTGARIVATANPGCMSQLENHVSKDIKVLHPVTILAQYLKTQGHPERM